MSAPDRMKYVCAAGFLALGIAYWAVWTVLATGLRDLVNEWVDDQRAMGWTIALEKPQLRGFPGWPNIDLTSLSIEAPLRDGEWSWQASSITIRPATFDITRLIIQAGDTHHLKAPWSAKKSWIALTDRADFEINLDTHRKVQGLHFTMSNGELSDSLARPLISIDYLDIDVAVYDPHRTSEDIFARFIGSLNGLRFITADIPAKNPVQSMQLELDLVGSIQEGKLSEALDGWRSDGGKLQIRRAALAWPPLRIIGNGSLALDKRLQPNGVFSTRIIGFKDTLQTMESSSIIPGDLAATAKLIFNLFSETPPAATEPELIVQLSIKDRRVSVGPLNLISIPQIHWD